MTIRKTLVTCCLLFIFLSSHSQKSDNQIDSLKGCQDKRIIDSLVHVLEGKSGGDRYPALHRLAVEYVDKDNEKALEIIQQAEESALLSGDTLSIVKSKRAKGQILFRLGRISEVIATYEAIYLIAREKKFMRECMSITNTLGSVYFMQSRFDQALCYHFQAYEIAVTENDSSGIAMVLNNIGTTYYKLKDYAKGLDYLKQGYEMDQAIADVAFDTPMNLSLCYVHLKDFENARRYLDASLKACGAKCPDYAMVHIRYVFGCLFLGLKQIDKAEDEFLKSYSLAKRMDNPRMQLDNIYLLVEIYTNKNLIPEAVKYLKYGEEIMNRGIPFNLEMIKIYSRLAEYYLLIQNFKKASIYQQRYIQLKDSIYNEAATLSLMRTEAEFLERENMARISAQNEVIALKEEIISHQRSLNKIAMLLFFTFVAFVVVLFRSYQQKKNINVLLEKKIRERTRELEISTDKSLREFQENNLLLIRTSQAIAETIRNIKGLCSLATKEVSDPLAHSYFERINTASGHLSHFAQTEYHQGPIGFIV